MTPLEHSNRLSDLAGRIRDADDAMNAAALETAECALETGRLLIGAKAECRHGEWLPFVRKAGMSERKAQRLMQLARSGLKSDTVSDLGIKGALGLLAKRREFLEVPWIIRTGRIVSEAERLEPGIMHRVLDGMVASRQEPTRAALMLALITTVRQAVKFQVGNN